MKTSRLIACGALVLAAAVAAPTLFAEDSAENPEKKRPLWNRLRQPRVEAKAPTEPAAPQPPAETPEAPTEPPAVPGAPQDVNLAAAKAEAPGSAAPPAPAEEAAPPAEPTPPPAKKRAAVEKSTAEEKRAADVAPPRARVRSGSREIDRIVNRLHGSSIGGDAAALPYLDLMATGDANAAELNDFAAYIARKGLIEEAAVIQRRAIELDRRNSMLWMNLGTIERGARRPDSAADAYRRAIELDGSNALAWYSLGVVQDGNEEYDAAVESFRRALTLDPSLADPTVNPQVVNNDRLTVVKLMLGQQKSGALSLPLVPLQKPAEAPSAADDAKARPADEKPPAVGSTPGTPPASK